LILIDLVLILIDLVLILIDLVLVDLHRVRLFDYDAVRALYEECIANPVATVTDVRKKSKSKWRPVALDTVVGLLTQAFSVFLLVEGV